ncbi:MAG TPA: hypothetical protein VFL72_00355, partial [Acidimicrobiia bacterium]|nr:hypothetical protein [Acidimicrobiia bacterium]
ITYRYLGVTRTTLIEAPKVFTTSPQVCEAPINREYETAAGAISDGMAPSWAPSDGRDVLLATGEAGTVLTMSWLGDEPNDCTAPMEVPLWSYRPRWAPPQDMVSFDSVLACPDGWFWWAPEPGTVMIWSDPHHPAIAP